MTKKKSNALTPLILPGVGAFPDAMDMLDCKDLTELIKTQATKKPFLGICLGMQLLFDDSEELGGKKGLSLDRGVSKD